MLKILVLAANPKDTSKLRLDQEIREIESGLQRSKMRDKVTLKSSLAVRPVDFQRAVLDFQPDIVHFCGFGEGERGLAFENDMGQTQLVSTEALSDFFKLFSDTVECVVLNACHSDLQAEAIAQHINYVIGMKHNIGDKSSIEFSTAFYDAIGAEKEIDFAYQLGRNAIQLSNSSEHVIPTLKCKPSIKKEPDCSTEDSMERKDMRDVNINFFQAISKLTGIDRQIRVKEWADANGVDNHFDMGPKNYQRCLYDLGLGGKHHELEYTENGRLKYQ